MAALPAALRAAVVLAAAVAAGTAGMAARGYDGHPHVARGQAALAVNDPRHAIEDFSRALEADPDLYAARVGRAQAYQRLGQFEQARDDWAKADAQRADGRTKACLAYCLSQLGKHELSLKYYQGALDARWGTAPVLNDFGHSLYRQHHFDEAEKCLENAVWLDPRLGLAYWNHALCDYQRARADPDKAYVPLRGITCIEKARTFFPSGAPVSLHHHAAWLYALAAERTPPDQPGQRAQYFQDALRAVESAVAQGYDPASLKTDPALQSLRADPRFQRATAAPPPAVPVRRPSLLVDPVSDFID